MRTLFFNRMVALVPVLCRNAGRVKCIFYVIVAALMVSCSSREADLQETVYGSPINMVGESDSLAIDSRTLLSYHLFTVYKDTVFAYNRAYHAIDVLDLGGKKPVSHLPLQKEGEDGIAGDLYGMCLQSRDSIWLYAPPFLYLVNAAGQVQKKVTLPFPEQGFINVETNFSMASNKLFYHPLRNSIFYLCVIPTTDSARYEVYEWELDSQEYQVYLLEGGALEAKAGQRFGWKQYPNVTYTDSLIVYNFPITSNVYTMNLVTREKKVFGGKSKFTPNVVSELRMPYSFQDADRHLLENVHFFEMQYDRENGLYYRLHLGKTSYDQSEEFGVQYKSKRLYLTVFNPAFQVIGEVDLGSGIYNYYNFWGVTGKGLFLAKNAKLNDEEESWLYGDYWTVQKN